MGMNGKMITLKRKYHYDSRKIFFLFIRIKHITPQFFIKTIPANPTS